MVRLTPPLERLEELFAELVEDRHADAGPTAEADRRLGRLMADYDICMRLLQRAEMHRPMRVRFKVPGRRRIKVE